MSESFGFADVDDLVAGVLFCRPFMGGEVDTTPPTLHLPDFPIHSFCCSKPYGVFEHLFYPIKMLLLSDIAIAIRYEIAKSSN